MKYYGYIPTSDGKEPLGTFGRVIFENKDERKAIRIARNRLGLEFKLFKYTNFYDPKTFTLVADTWTKRQP